jgi:hypothetical protein
MTEIRVNGNVSATRLKALDPARAEQAKQRLEAKRDGFDTYGLKTEAGDKLLLITSRKPLKAGDVVTVGGKQASISFVENEANTFGERFKASFKGDGRRPGPVASALLAGGIVGALCYPVLPGLLGTVAGAAVVAVVFAAVTIAQRFLATKVKTDESVTDALAPK